MRTRNKTDHQRVSSTPRFPLAWKDVIEKEGVYEWDDDWKENNGRSFYVNIGQKTILGYSAKRQELFPIADIDWKPSPNRFRELRGAEVYFDITD